MKLFAYRLVWYENDKRKEEPTMKEVFARDTEHALQVISNENLNHDSYRRVLSRWNTERQEAFLIESFSPHEGEDGIVLWNHRESRYYLLPPPEPPVYLRDFEIGEKDDNM